MGVGLSEVEQELLDRPLLARVDPADDVAHRAVDLPGRRKEQRRQELLGHLKPELGVATARGSVGARQVVRHPPGVGPLGARGDRIPADQAGVVEPRRAGRVVDPDLPDRASRGEGVVEQVALHRDRHHRPGGLEDRRDGEAGGLAGLARADDERARARLGRDEAPAEPAERETAGLGARHDERPQVARPRPARARGARRRPGRHGDRQTVAPRQGRLP